MNKPQQPSPTPGPGVPAGAVPTGYVVPVELDGQTRWVQYAAPGHKVVVRPRVGLALLISWILFMLMTLVDLTERGTFEAFYIALFAGVVLVTVSVLTLSKHGTRWMFVVALVPTTLLALLITAGWLMGPYLVGLSWALTAWGMAAASVWGVLRRSQIAV